MRVIGTSSLVLLLDRHQVWPRITKGHAGFRMKLNALSTYNSQMSINMTGQRKPCQSLWTVLSQRKLTWKSGQATARPHSSLKPLAGMLIAGLSAYCAEETTATSNEKKVQTDLPTGEDLDEEHIIRQACVAAINSASTALTQVTVAILAAHEKYRHLLECIMKLMKQTEDFTGTDLEDQLWQLIIACRANIQDQKKKIADLENQLISVVNLVNAAAEAAFSAKAEYAGIAGSERVLSAEQAIKQSRMQIQRLEMEMAQQQKEIMERPSSQQEEAAAEEKQDNPKS